MSLSSPTVSGSPMRWKVVITDLIVEPLHHERRVLQDVADVVALDASSEKDLVGKIEDADAIMVYHYFHLTKQTIDRLTKCRVIVRPGVGYDGVDIAAARERGIPVCNVPDYGTEEVADSALGMAICLARGSHFLNSRCKSHVCIYLNWCYSEIPTNCNSHSSPVVMNCYKIAHNI
jgi:D-3-phosphoglycerate dehydrogenase/C-terminal binding protein